MSDIKVYYLYSTEPGNSGMRYIGQTKHRLTVRLRGHRRNLTDESDTYAARWIRSVYAKGYEVRIGLLKGNAIWNTDEMAMIKKYRALGYRLTNSTDGGDGILNPSTETRLKLSAIVSGQKHYLFGKHLCKETKRKISKAHKGKIISHETRIKMSESLKGHCVSKETRRKISETQKGKIVSLRTCKKLRESRSRQIFSQETRHRMSVSAERAWAQRSLECNLQI